MPREFVTTQDFRIVYEGEEIEKVYFLVKMIEIYYPLLQPQNKTFTYWIAHGGEVKSHTDLQTNLGADSFYVEQIEKIGHVEPAFDIVVHIYNGIHIHVPVVMLEAVHNKIDPLDVSFVYWIAYEGQLMRATDLAEQLGAEGVHISRGDVLWAHPLEHEE